MASQAPLEGDPLIAALPPATDYMTYLTLLEYQLTPQNLQTLSKLLSDDDGTLASEIGWDLLKLVLRFLAESPGEASRCLEIIARRGNPREVVVRVAEELEKLGDGEEDLDDIDGDADDGEDELPTFAGEAPRIHLGTMTLDGMPPIKSTATDAPVSQADVKAPVTRNPTDKTLKLQALLSMLGILHPRIKTQYPSRFLATSLPAALGAYRHVPITAATTTSFLAVLEQLAGKSRPPLPPRASATQVPVVASFDQSETTSASAAPLPDPEAKTEGAEKGANTPSADEKAIISRLLHAVLLEILDEYLSSLTDGLIPSMSWTGRLRETLEPSRVVPHRPTETHLFETAPELKEREDILVKVQKISFDLGYDIAAEVKKLVHADNPDQDDDEEAEPEPSEYPTSPAQIPLPRAGVIYLYAYQSYLKSGRPDSLVSIPAIAQLIDHSFPLSATPAIPSAALLDSLLSLLYTQTLAAAGGGQAVFAETLPSPAKFLLLISTLTQLFSIAPWPALRDSAHQIATKLLHVYPKADVRLQIIAQTIEGNTLSTNWAEFEEEPDHVPGIDEETGLTRSTSALEPHPIPLAPPQQLGVLRAAGADWLKEEFGLFLRDGDKSGTVGLDPALITDDKPEAEGKGARSLLDLLFPTDLPVLGQSAPAGPERGFDNGPDSDTDTALADFLLNIPFYISTLNLLSIILSQQRGPEAATNPSIFSDRIRAHVTSLGSSLNFLATVAAQAEDAKSGDGDSNSSAYLVESRADINALHDAHSRVQALV